MRKQSIGEYAVHKVDGNENLIHKCHQGSKSKSVDITKKSIADEVFTFFPVLKSLLCH